MTKEQLKRYRERKLELQDINAGISNSTIHDSVSGSKKEFPWTIGTRHVEGVPDEDYGLLVRKSNVTNVTHVTNRHAIIIIRNDINYRFLVAVSFIFYTPCLTLLSELWSDWQERKIYLDISGDINVYSSANQTHDKYRQSAYVLQ